MLIRSTARISNRLFLRQFSRVSVHDSWRPTVEVEISKPYFSQELRPFLAEEGKMHTIYPPRPLVFNALDLCPLDTVKVVILGQDPYHQHGQAHGLSFSVLRDVKVPPSLRNILAELEDDLGCGRPQHGNLESWARQGVLLLNTVLTVRANEPNSHQQQGWELFTSAMLRQVLATKTNVVVLLWGARAIKSFSTYLGDDQEAGIFLPHTVLTASHPSPLGATKTSQPFIGCRHFSQTNAILAAAGEQPIDWELRP
jgi:uracil-DNA glycosylase